MAKGRSKRGFAGGAYGKKTKPHGRKNVKGSAPKKHRGIGSHLAGYTRGKRIGD